jgi:hypothetical protein
MIFIHVSLCLKVQQHFMKKTKTWFNKAYQTSIKTTPSLFLRVFQSVRSKSVASKSTSSKNELTERVGFHTPVPRDSWCWCTSHHCADTHLSPVLSVDTTDSQDSIFNGRLPESIRFPLASPGWLPWKPAAFWESDAKTFTSDFESCLSLIRMVRSGETLENGEWRKSVSERIESSFAECIRLFDSYIWGTSWLGLSGQGHTVGDKSG